MYIHTHVCIIIYHALQRTGIVIQRVLHCNYRLVEKVKYLYETRDSHFGCHFFQVSSTMKVTKSWRPGNESFQGHIVYVVYIVPHTSTLIDMSH